MEARSFFEEVWELIKGTLLLVLGVVTEIIEWLIPFFLLILVLWVSVIIFSTLGG